MQALAIQMMTHETHETQSKQIDGFDKFRPILFYFNEFLKIILL